MNLNKQLVAIVILAILYTVGIVGTLFYSDSLLALTPINLLVGAALVFLNHKSLNTNFVIYTLVIFIAGFLVELLGINTGKIFGQYFYGNNLGVMLWDVPLVIGLNWLVLSYATMCLVQPLSVKISVKWQPFVLAFISALGMVMVDALIEPLCQRLDFWYWRGSIAPLENYTAWFMFSFAFNFLGFKLNVAENNQVAKAILLAQVVFFTSLNIWLV